MPRSLSRRGVPSLQAVELQAVLCSSMGASEAWKGATAFISRLDPARFDKVEQEVNRRCAVLSDCPMDCLAVLGWDGYGDLVPRESFGAAVSSHVDHLAVPVDPSRVLNCISLHPAGVWAHCAHFSAVLPHRAAQLLAVCVRCKLHVLHRAAWCPRHRSPGDDAAWLCLVLQAMQMNSLWKRLSLEHVHPDKLCARQVASLGFHETLPGGVGLIPEMSKVQQPCFCVDLQSSTRGQQLHPCLQPQLPRRQPAGHTMQCSTSPRSITAAGGCVMVQDAQAARAGGHWSQATTAARCHILRATVSCRLQVLHATIVHSWPALGEGGGEGSGLRGRILGNALPQTVLGAACRSVSPTGTPLHNL